MISTEHEILGGRYAEPTRSQMDIMHDHCSCHRNIHRRRFEHDNSSFNRSRSSICWHYRSCVAQPLQKIEWKRHDLFGCQVTYDG